MLSVAFLGGGKSADVKLCLSYTPVLEMPQFIASMLIKS